MNTDENLLHHNLISTYLGCVHYRFAGWIPPLPCRSPLLHEAKPAEQMEQVEPVLRLAMARFLPIGRLNNK